MSFALLFALVAAPFARQVECVPDCCRAADGSTMAACPMRAASPGGDCQIRECAPETAATVAVSVQPALLTQAVAQLELAPSGASVASPLSRLLFAQRDPLIPPPRT